MRAWQRVMGRRTWWLLVCLAVLLAVVEVWVYYTERNKRVRALRLHVLAVHQLIASGTCGRECLQL